MRTSLLLPLVAWTSALLGCVTMDGPRQLLRESPVGTRCEPGPPGALLDAEVTDRVRLVFSQSEHCTDTSDATYSKTQRVRLSDGARGVLAVGAGLIVGIPLTALAIVGAAADQRAVGPARHQTSALGEPIGYGIVLLSLAAGGGAHEALRASDPRPSIEVTERIWKQRLDERTVRRGQLNGPGLPVGGLPLSPDGTLELSLEEAQGLAEGEFYLDGRRVELNVQTQDRLSFLTVCKEAVDGFEASRAPWSPKQTLLWRLAEACDRRGWTFAEEARLTASAPRP